MTGQNEKMYVKNSGLVIIPQNWVIKLSSTLVSHMLGTKPRLSHWKPLKYSFCL